MLKFMMLRLTGGYQTVKKGQQKLAFFDIIKSGVRTC